MTLRFPEILLLLGSAILIFGYFIAPGFALPRLIGFIVLALGFYMRRRR